jgi:Tol biopolymer transport system component
MTAIEPGTLLGPYEIIALLGSGGMGEVYHARDARLGRAVALKVLPQRDAGDAARNTRLINEARMISSLSHPHIRAVYDATEHDGVAVIVMEYLTGETLDQRLSRRPLPLMQAIDYATQLASALDAAHTESIVHHDVKPSNVMVTARGAVLLDFGIATLCPNKGTDQQNRDASTLSDSGSIPGTTAYMAPEQLDGSNSDPRSDIFSLGIVLYEMISGRKPFEGATRARMIAAILEHEPAKLSSVVDGLPPALDRLVMKCLAKDPRNRWQTARDLASELAWIGTNLEFLSTGTTSTSQVPEPRRWVRAGAAAGTLALVALTAFIGTRSARPVAAPLQAPVRFLASAPANTTITVTSGAFSVSPDGRFLAFTAAAGGGPQLLWIRSLESFEARPLSGTDGAGFPFWSPDSREIAFFTGSQLKSVEVERATVRLVAEVGSAEWGAWGSRGDIIYTRGRRGLFKVRASGGVPMPALMGVMREGLQFGGPEFLPDGDHFVMGVLDRASPKDVTIYVASLSSDTATELLKADSQAIFAEPGYLLYMQGGNLIAHPFDARQRRLSGEPVVLPEPAAFVRAQRRASFSVSHTGVIAYRQGVTTTQLTWVDRSGRKLSTVGMPGRYVNPAVAPDGLRIAVTRVAPSTTESDIWVLEPRGERLLTSGSGMKDYAVWSPDGTRLAYSAETAGGFMDLFAKEADASSQEPGVELLSTPHRKLAMDWTRDGARLLFLDSARGTQPRVPVAISLRHRNGDAPAQALGGNDSAPSEYQAQMSPSGRFMAYVSEVSGSSQVYVREFPEGRRWQISTEGGFEPKWRGDGRELYYVAADQQMMAVAVSDNPLFSIGQPTPLFRTEILGAPFQNGFVRNEYAVTSDGQRFLINQPAGGPAAYAIRIVLNWQELLRRPQLPSPSEP